MKKIVRILVFILFVCFSFISYHNYKVSEFSNLIGSNYYTVSIKEKNKNVIEVLNAVSEKNDTLIGKYYYEYATNGKTKLIIYVSTYHEPFIQELSIDQKKKIFLGDGNYYTTNKNDKRDKVIGYINVLNSDLELEIKGLQDLDIHNSNSSTFIDAKNDHNLYSIVNELNEQNIDVSYNPDEHYLENNLFETY